MIALVVILATALGAAVTLIVILLFLRSHHLGQRPGDIDRQITEAEVRAELFRELKGLTGPPEHTTRAGGEPSRQAAVNGTDHEHETLPGLIRTKRHLSILKGGAISALILAITSFVREHRGRAVAALVGAGTTATSVTVLTITPWQDNNGGGPPSSAPTATATITQPPPPTVTRSPPGAAPSDDGRPPPSASATTSPEASPSATVSPSASASPGPEPTSSTAPIANEPPVTEEPPPGEPSRPPRGDGDATTPDEPGDQPPGEPPPAGAPPSEPAPPPPSETPVSDLCASLTVQPLLDTEACLPVG